MPTPYRYGSLENSQPEPPPTPLRSRTRTLRTGIPFPAGSLCQSAHRICRDGREDDLHRIADDGDDTAQVDCWRWMAFQRTYDEARGTIRPK